MRLPAVEITGRGVVSCLGQTIPQFSEAVLAGKVGIRAVEKLANLRFKTAAPIEDFDAAAHFDERTRGTIDRFTQFAAVAGREAWAESGLGLTAPDPTRIAVVIGSANGGIDIIDEGYRRLYVDNTRPRPLTVPLSMSSAPASRIALQIGARGPVFAPSTACASAAHAILLGHMLIATGQADVAVVGGTDSCFSDGYLRAWDSLRVVSMDTCRPFSKDRQGLIIGEGAGVMVLEREGAAAARGARPVARLLGGAMSSDAGDLLAPDPDGMVRAMRGALIATGCNPGDIDYINAHGTGTPANDKAESAAINLVFENRAVPVSSTKSMLGHALGASGALEALTTIAALQQGILPPTMNFLAPDPNCPVDAVPNAPRKAGIRTAISNSFAFGGLNVTLVLGRADG
jgi:nodulation protein E